MFCEAIILSNYFSIHRCLPIFIQPVASSSNNLASSPDSQSTIPDSFETKKFCFWKKKKNRQLDPLLSLKTNSLLCWTEKRHFLVLLLLMYLKNVSLDVFWKLLLISCLNFPTWLCYFFVLLLGPLPSSLLGCSILVRVSAIQAALYSICGVSSYFPYLSSLFPFIEFH